MIATTKSRGAVVNRPDHTGDKLKKASEKGGILHLHRTNNGLVSVKVRKEGLCSS